MLRSSGHGAFFSRHFAGFCHRSMHRVLSLLEFFRTKGCKSREVGDTVEGVEKQRNIIGRRLVPVGTWRGFRTCHKNKKKQKLNLNIVRLVNKGYRRILNFRISIKSRNSLLLSYSNFVWFFFVILADMIHGDLVKCKLYLACRERKSTSNMSGYASANEPSNLEDEVDGHFGWLDAIRVLFGVLLASQLTVKCVSGYWWFPTFDWWSRAGTPDIGLGYWSTHNYTIPYNFTLRELSQFSGDNSKSNGQPILLAINRTVFDVSSSPRFYGAWGAYKKFTGTDCSNNFQFGIFDYHAYSTPCHWDVSGFDESQMAKLAEWYRFFESKYPSVGTVILETDIEGRF